MICKLGLCLLFLDETTVFREKTVIERLCVLKIPTEWSFVT